MTSDRPSWGEVPRPPTSFVGRQSELGALERLLARARLVTVLGPPGVGKTRLAAEHAARHHGPGGWCDLADALGLDAVCDAVGRTVGVAPEPGATLDAAVEQLASALAARGAFLLVLDNFEQLTALAGASIVRWLRAAPALRVLVTSRTRLRVAGESLLDLAPLAPAAAAELFEDRARAVRGRSLGEGDAPAVAALVRHLDGLPLALELAAARVRLLTPAQIVRSLEQDGRFEIVPLGRAIDLSWEHLAGWERAALAQCAVFRGGFTLEAAADVLGLSAHAEAPATLDVLESLADKSLLAIRRPQETPDEARFAVYQSLRDYLWKKLEASGEAAGALERHARHYLAAGARWAAEAFGPSDALARLGLEAENLAAVHRRALRGPSPGPEEARRAVGAALALEPLLATRGPGRFLLALLDDALSCPGAAGLEPSLRAKALEARGSALRVLGRMAESTSAYEEALAIAEREGDRRLAGRLLAQLAFQHTAQGRYGEATAHFARALPIVEGADLPWEARIREMQGHLALHERAFDEARRRFEEALVLFQRCGDRRREIGCLGNVARVDHQEGRLEEAGRRFEEGLRLLRAPAGDERARAWFAANLALLRQERGELELARKELERTIRTYRRLGLRRTEGIVLGYLATAWHEEGRLEEASASYEAARAILAEVGEALYESLALGGLGAIEATRGHVAAAGELLDAAEAKLGELGDRTFIEAVRVHRGHLDLARAREASARPRKAAEANRRAARGRDTSAEQLRASARARLAAAEGMRSTDLRAAARLLTRAIAADDRARAAGTGLPGAPAARPVLAVGPAGDWFVPPGGVRVDLRRRRALRLILARLADDRVRAPGQSVPVDELQQAGWPGEKLLPEAGADRVYTAMSTLRRLGLRDLLSSRDGGYLLETTADLTRDPPEP